MEDTLDEMAITIGEEESDDDDDDDELIDNADRQLYVNNLQQVQAQVTFALTPDKNSTVTSLAALTQFSYKMFFL